ncbi:UBX domain-containing protein 6 [Marchantia polymorpha subsp. ruderalis]|uniref:UBX domain-containing protein n=2 Tax=Marchantia polymorpha TaxID=3197 RepID=A0A176VDC3_MARPO|nr:hypothetical protein AXG93_1783s1110 [Marchantia polymorpha subsp. ruderalis]PTQ34334.1 hypothetical protein MARPO_0081s0058 [Marchantia polymorpha]BBN18795.1 hypothetical protein Mp_8g05570 [Marchantia polymorpha subsp. ruderalis]|eukprot:PTQ34334.1 hypothetical protein MARPO_0081s0058 [Marchantia polymorpha]
MDEKLKEKVDEMKTKGKDLLKKFSSPFGFSRSTPTFKGQGHTLGGPTQSRSIPDPVAAPSNSIGRGSSCNSRPGSACGGHQKAQQVDWRKLQQEKWERERGIAPSAQVPAERCGPASQNSAQMHRVQSPGHGHVMESVNTLASAAASVKSPLDNSIKVDTRESRGTVQVINNEEPRLTTHNSTPDLLTGSHFDPYSPILSSRGTSSSSMQGFAGQNVPHPVGKVQCPVCLKFWNSEAEVSAHIDDCTGVSKSVDFSGLTVGGEDIDRRVGAFEREQDGNLDLDLDEAVATFLSQDRPAGTIDVILRLLRNILADPSSDKFRKIRLENQKIKEALGSSMDGLRVFLAVGFSLVGRGSESMLVMGVPSDEQKLRIETTIDYLVSHQTANTTSAPSSAAGPVPVKVDRQLKIFYAPKDRLEERFELPGSFYELTAAEVKLEAQARKKKIEDSQLLIPKSLREKKAAAVRRRYKATVLRVQLPDGLILQGYFGAKESTTALYEFVASTLNDSHETFDLVLPAATKHRVIPRFLEAGGQCLTLEEADLIPKALLKFKPTGGAPFTGLKSEYYGLCEQLTLTTLLDPVDLLSK